MKLSSELSSRTRNSFLNLAFSLGGKFVDLILQFILRTVFIYTLGQEYLGLGGLFTNILSFLSLAELGIGTAITFSLYKPIAENNERQLSILMRIFKKAYICVGLAILVIGASLTPFLNLFINEMPDIPNIHLMYILFVANSGVSYFYSYKSSFIIANQKNYIVTNNMYLMRVICVIFQIIELFVCKNYIGYLIVQLIFTIIANIRISRIADKMYPVLKICSNEPLEANTKKTILANIGAMVFHRVGDVIVFSTDNILISKMFGLIAVGVYSNYVLIITAVESILSQFFSSITASIGNLGVAEDRDHQVAAFENIFFMTFWLYSFATIAIGILIQSFIQLWLGDNYLFPVECVVFVVFNFYLKGMRQAAMTFDVAYGLMRFYKYMPIPESIINLGASVILGLHFGLVGIFIGTTLSTLFAPFWIEPYVLNKYGLKTSLRKYFLKYAAYTFFTIILFLATYYACSFITVQGVSGFLLQLIIVLLIPNSLIILFFWRTKEFQYLFNLMKKTILFRNK